MKKFSIDVKASGEKEMKKARKYLRDQRHFVQTRKSSMSILYLSNCNGRGLIDTINYYGVACSDEEILILPQDWDKLIEYTKKDCKASEAFNGMFDPIVLPTNFKSFFNWNPKGCSMANDLQLELENKLLQAKIDLAKVELKEITKKL